MYRWVKILPLLLAWLPNAVLAGTGERRRQGVGEALMRTREADKAGSSMN